MIKWSVSPPRPVFRQPVQLALLAWLALVCLTAVFAPLLAPQGPTVTNTLDSLQPPGQNYWLGADLLGRDLLTRLLWGSRWTLGMAVGGLAVTIGVGLPLGIVAGTFGGRLDTVLMRLVDALLAFPGLLLAMAVVSLLGSGIGAVAIAVGFAAAPGYARVVRTAAVEVRTELFIEAARSVGCTQWRILIRHIFPNTITPLIAFAAAQLGWVLLNGAALNFLGLGVSPGTPEWGAMLVEGRNYLRDAPWVSTFPGLALALTVLAANLLGDTLQRAFEPR